MRRYEFILKLNRNVTPEEVEALYEAGCGDGAVETGPLGALIDFSREAPGLAAALVSAVHDIEKVEGLRAVGVQCQNMVTMADIADRAGVTREAVRLWAAGQRGAGNFPPPVMITTGGEKIWDWEQVDRWLAEREEPARHPAMSAEARMLCTADRVLAARAALWAEPDDSVREEFERLLQDA